MKDEKFTFTKREIHQFLEKRRLPTMQFLPWFPPEQ